MKHAVTEQWPSLRRAGSAAVALIAGAAAAIAALVLPAFLRAYLIGWLLCLGVALGAFTFLCVHHIVHGRWGATVRPILEAAARTIPPLALLFLPIALGVAVIYPWTDAAFLQGGPLRAAKADYLDVGFFLARSAAILLAWSLLAWLLARPGRLRPGLAAVSLVVYFPTVTIAAVDWVLSLDPDMSSSAFGLNLATGNAAAGWSVVLLTAAVVEARAGRPVIPVERVHELGTLLFVTVMLWAYIAFTQYLLIWSADLPWEAHWYLVRTSGGWLVVAWSLVALHFAAPFLLLLFRPIKRRLRRLAGVAVLLLVMHVVELCWMILPARPLAPGGGAGAGPLDVLVPLGLAAAWAAVFLTLLARAPRALEPPRTEVPHDA